MLSEHKENKTFPRLTDDQLTTMSILDIARHIYHNVAEWGKCEDAIGCVAYNAGQSCFVAALYTDKQAKMIQSTDLSGYMPSQIINKSSHTEIVNRASILNNLATDSVWHGLLSIHDRAETIAKDEMLLSQLAVWANVSKSQISADNYDIQCEAIRCEGL